ITRPPRSPLFPYTTLFRSYGVGRATAGILAELGYEIDVSVVPGTDLTCKFGPDFTHCGASPYWFGKNPELLEIPLSIGYTGLLRSEEHTSELQSLAYLVCR